MNVNSDLITDMLVDVLTNESAMGNKNRPAALLAGFYLGEIADAAESYDACLSGLLVLKHLGQEDSEFFREGEEILSDIHNAYLVAAQGLQTILDTSLNLSETDRVWRHSRI